MNGKGIASSLSVLVLAVGLFNASSACVVSSGFEEIPEEDNVLVLDGEELAFDQVVAEKQEGLEPWAHKRLARISGRVGELIIAIDLDSFDAGDRDVVPFGDVAIVGTDGPESDIRSDAVSGIVRVIEGSESRLVVELENVVLREVCGGSDQVIASARLAADLVVGLEGLAAIDPGATGYIEAQIDAGEFSDGPVELLGIAGGSVSTRSNGQQLFRTETSDACASRERPLILLMNILPEELPAPGTPVRFSSLPVSAAFLIVVARPATIFRSATLVGGTITVSDAVSLDDGSVLDAVIEDAVFDEYLDINEEPTGEVPPTADRITLRVVMGRPDF